MAILFAGVGMASVSTVITAQPLLYSQQFEEYAAYYSGQSQYDNWLSFRESLPESGVTSITVKGSNDPVGRTCSDPVKAQQIADAIRAGAADLSARAATLSINCDDFYWNTGSCSLDINDPNNLELNVGPEAVVCTCTDSNYVLRPAIFSSAWGGIAGSTCAPPTQTLAVEVNANDIELNENDVHSIDIDIKPNSDQNSINLCSKGVVPVAILGSNTLDVDDIKIGSLRFAEAAVKVVGKKDSQYSCSYQDVNGDSNNDLVCNFEMPDIAVVDGESTDVAVNGELIDGTVIEGNDSITIVKDICN
jgi:hypothetical protein